MSLTHWTDEQISALIEDAGGVDEAIMRALQRRHKGQMTYELWGRVGSARGWTDDLRAKADAGMREQVEGQNALHLLCIRKWGRNPADI